jgi:hypothetical protein
MKALLPYGFLIVALVAAPAFADVKVGQSYQTRVNLHADGNRKTLFSMNYQLGGGMIPVCSDVKITKVKKKYIQFTWQDALYTLKYDGHTKKAGITLQNFADDWFAEKCDKSKMATLSKLDKQGIASGEPIVGMTKQGIIYAMGRPPYHATPSTDALTWMYWMNRYKRKAIEFDAKGKVINIRL